jgi:outer membrane protein assembly factor BamB
LLETWHVPTGVPLGTAVNGEDGHVEWSRALGEQVYGEWLIGGTIIGGTLVVDVDEVGTHAKVVGLGPSTGAVLWQYRPGGRGLLGDPVPVGAWACHGYPAPARSLC